MVITCVAYGCFNKQKKGEKPSFHRFPGNEVRLAKWVTAIKRENWFPTEYSFLCGEHFVSGKPSNDPNHPDFVPTAKPNIRQYEKRKQRCDAREAIKKPEPGCPSKLSEFRKPDWVPSQKIGYDVAVGSAIPSKRQKKEPENVKLNVLKQIEEWFPTIKDCDFKVLTEMLKQGKVTNEVLENCDLVYICKSCRNIYTEFDKFTRHYQVCNHLLSARDKRTKGKMSVDVDNFQTSESETEMTSLNSMDNYHPLELLQVKMEPDDQNEEEDELANEGTVSETLHQTDQNIRNDKIMKIDNYKFVCLKCAIRIESAADLEAHKAKFHSKVLRCNLCEYQCDSLEKLDEHLFEWHGGENSGDDDDDDNGGASVGDSASSRTRGEAKNEESEFTNSKTDKDENDAAILLSSRNGRYLMDGPQKFQTNDKKFYFVTLTEEQMMNGEKFICLRCKKGFAQTSDLRKHLAIDHLG